MPSIRANTPANTPLPTKVGVENEYNGVEPREAAEVIRQTVGGVYVEVPQQEIEHFEGDVFHVRDPAGNIWKAKADASCGAETNSPPMTTYGHLWTNKSIATGMQQKTRATVGPNTGLHVHYYLGDLTPKQAVVWFALMHRHQPFVYRAFHVYTPRLNYCAPLESAVVGSIIDHTPDTLADISDAFGEQPSDRDRYLNAQNLEAGGIKTGEVRAFNATMDPVYMGMAVSLGLRAYEIAQQSTGNAPWPWRDSIDSPAAFAADFGLAANHPLLNYMTAQAQRPLTALERVTNDAQCFKDLTLAERDTFAVALEAVSSDGKLLGYVGPTAALNPRIVETACIQNGAAMACAHESFKRSEQFIYGLIARAGDILAYVDEPMRNNAAIVYRGVTEGSYMVLAGAGQTILSNFEFIRAVSLLEPLALQYAQLPLQQFKEVALEIIPVDSEIFKTLPIALRNDSDVALAAVTDNAGLFHVAGPGPRSDPWVAIEAVQGDLINLQHVCPSLLADAQFLQSLVYHVPAARARLTPAQQRLL